MHYYAPDTNRKGKRAGLIALACYLAVFVCVSLLVSFDMNDVQEEKSEGILIDFGTETDGFGTDNLALAEEVSPTSSQSGTSEEELMTQENEDAPAIRTSSAKSKKTSSTAKNNHKPQDKTVTTTEQQQPEVNRRALFPGRSTTSAAASQGSTVNAAGNAGNASGGDGSSDGTGTGDSGISFSLAGRRPVGNLPKPAYSSDSQGRIVIEITVDAQGRVQTASFHPQGSTTQNSSLREAAIKAARQAKFTTNEANAVQTGTITYIFRLQ